MKLAGVQGESRLGNRGPWKVALSSLHSELVPWPMSLEGGCVVTNTMISINRHWFQQSRVASIYRALLPRHLAICSTGDYDTIFPEQGHINSPFDR